MHNIQCLRRMKISEANQLCKIWQLLYLNLYRETLWLPTKCHSHLCNCTLYPHFWQWFWTLSAYKKRRVGDAVMQWYVSPRKPINEAAFHRQSWSLWKQPSLCKNSVSKRGQALSHPSPPGRNFTLSAYESPGDTTHPGPAPHLLSGGWGREGGYKDSRPFIMFSPQTAVVQTDLTLSRKVCHQHSSPVEHFPTLALQVQ